MLNNNPAWSPEQLEARKALFQDFAEMLQPLLAAASEAGPPAPGENPVVYGLRVLHAQVQLPDLAAAIQEDIDYLASTFEAPVGEQAAAARSRGGNRGGSPYDGFLFLAAEQLCGGDNQPVAEQRLLDTAEALAKEAADEAGEAPPTRLAYLLKRALVKMCRAQKPDLLHDADNDTYTLKVPPPPLEFD